MNFYDVIRQAIADFERHGFDSAERMELWLGRIREAATASMVPEHKLQDQLDRSITEVFAQQIEKGSILSKHPTVQRFTLERIKPKLRAELDRRLMASAQLIKMNREAMIQKTLQRFSGWASSIPAGGSDVIEKREVKEDLAKALKQLPFEERRVMIDQGAKFKSSLDSIIATDGGAIAGMWRSNWKQRGYNYREDHKERDNKVYLIRGSWAHKSGLVKPKDGYTDDQTQPGEEVFCQCNYKYIYHLRDLPEDMLTNKGKEQLYLAVSQRMGLPRAKL